ncbi:tRNA 2-thiouridine(34) synthase MnmA [Candidatus Kaiserbacteria bacterium RIFCSPHIGHO2_02_FULL_55_25]|uniref:tRNA-specific 2-thiouridylase MnmA n=1 Tax=Candidatus Kaiserbacteria bacterium RIFCSPHIGHO2_02_FULL_55_25 TaxID=1798498 RepID=A0A1F6EAR9_9BACT|nr:MAG: tRNA 2-thiouridine(34) synthase MnmA [Candidatus Kaiserbacteria bacterium RIFCSPHIGHO2_01_FULL_55_79]OGG70758.1 MAG: tRNA 2-thiouridine(34) synthase MnmA [Candidatus Kaiserbacteria bacterium RIFCSPHIGHO2_02_FULL_55_25]OGG76913.1 MAG: tRNA 2-thiouridine(34) synthase MnmA [Candidatus Kaiserbacteria bacterium RIFCSPHIGHO2_12_FULL_55_13]OGG83449.1 MAG: tRNA 2-thiouridine(34) synthase MnmA [Candidatus Kaiserbacteria bacterium RIFCSPLOWO2_01_FULL_55_25]
MAHTVFVGLSGGVDSAVSAALLKEQGHKVVGVFIKIWQPEFIECTWQRDRLDAMRVAAALGIPFKEIDLSEEYKNEVVTKMISSYSAGETPNPDVLCNRSIKFGAFSKWARAEGADVVATGHYAQIKQGEHGPELWRGVDKDKDQSYFLYQLNQGDLSRSAFPVGAMTKKQVRAYAKAHSLPVAQKPDSQGLCFVGDVSMRDFLKRFITVAEGRVTDKKGHILGVHEGAALYTIGQRHGFTVTKKQLAKTPHYVTGIDTKNNIVIVSANRSDAARAGTVVLDMHWISGVAPSFLTGLAAQMRYRETPLPIKLRSEGKRAYVDFGEPHVISPGQSAVVYDGGRCLGGGILAKNTAPVPAAAKPKEDKKQKVMPFAEK